MYTQSVNLETEVTRVIKSVMNYKVCNLKGFQAHYVDLKRRKVTVPKNFFVACFNPLIEIEFLA